MSELVVGAVCLIVGYVTGACMFFGLGAKRERDRISGKGPGA